ncbi:hypothetical protein NMG60_11036045 [Bertholletia excelsa]
MVSASSSSSPFNTALYRLMLIAFGAVVALVINICVCPIWAGEDLHKSVVKNFEGLASSLEGCVNGYIQCLEYRRVPSKILTYQASDDPIYDGYRSAVQSSSKEESLLEFAIWEPPHGPYKGFKYPWINYVKVSGALRHCAFMVMAMHGCILSEIQAPQEKRRVFGNELLRVGIEGAKVLRELGNKVARMEKLSQGDLLLQVHEAAKQLQMKIDQKSYLLVNSELWESGRLSRDYEDPQNFHDKNLVTKSLSEKGLNVRSIPLINPCLSDLPDPRTVSGRDAGWPSPLSLNAEAMFAELEAGTYESASSLSLATFVSLLIEFVARLQNLVNSFEELSVVAEFREPVLEARVDKEGDGFWRRLVRCFRFKNPSSATVNLRHQYDMV